MAPLEQRIASVARRERLKAAAARWRAARRRWWRSDGGSGAERRFAHPVGRIGMDPEPANTIQQTHKKGAWP
jgi:hypothetical protein